MTKYSKSMNKLTTATCNKQPRWILLSRTSQASIYCVCPHLRKTRKQAKLNYSVWGCLLRWWNCKERKEIISREVRYVVTFRGKGRGHDQEGAGRAGLPAKFYFITWVLITRVPFFIIPCAVCLCFVQFSICHISDKKAFKNILEWFQL